MTARPIGSLATEIVNDLAERTGREKPFPEEPMNPYAKWQARCAGENPPMHEIEPEAGFWRTKDRDTKQFTGVAIWPDGDTLVAMRGKSVVPVDRVWPWCGRYPITEETYRAWEATGIWPDADPGTAVPPAPIGHNAPVDEAEALRDQIESAKAGADGYATIADDETAARAQSLRSRLLELSREADNKRKAEKEPHLEASRSVDGKWMPLVKDAKDIADRIAKAMSAYETAKARALAEAQRHVEEERRKREEEVRKAAEAGRPAPEPAPPPVQEAPPSPATQIRGGYGRAASVRVVKVVQDVTDWNALFAFLQPHPEMQDTMRKLAQRAVDKGHDVPGVRVEEERKVA